MPRPPRGGFSLLELLIALTILAIALIPVAYFYSKSLQMVEEAGIRTRALMLGQERITELQQIPYDQLCTNVTPAKQQLLLYAKSGVVNTTAADWFGYDFETGGAAAGHPAGVWAAMFHYPLPLTYNPYDPKTQGYDNTEGINRYTANSQLAGEGSTHVNFDNGTTRNYEYEPIGFYSQRVFLRNQALPGAQRADINLSDRRTLGPAEPPISNGPAPLDRFRTGSEGQVDNYSIFGRRTIILDILPNPRDSDGSATPTNFETGTDGFLPNDDRDGGATVFDPYPLFKGPDNKFQMLSDHGTRGKLVIVQVFWLPRKAPSAYIPLQDLNKIELKTFIPANSGSGGPRPTIDQVNRNDFLNITPPT